MFSFETVVIFLRFAVNLVISRPFGNNMYCIFRHFVQGLDFTGMEIDQALRLFQTQFRMPVCITSMNLNAISV